MTTLKLAAFDSEDLEVVSAHLQDAVMRVADMAYLPKHKRFAVVLNRFDWEKAIEVETGNSSSGEKFERRRSALRFERVLAARTKGISLDAGKAILSLLAVQFKETDAPAGTITLVFAGDSAIQLDVECIEAELKDLGAVWATKSRPSHDEAEPKP